MRVRKPKNGTEDEIKKVWMIDSVGAHRGMHYYNFPLVSEINKSSCFSVEYLSTELTADHPLKPENVPAIGVFRGIYGGERKYWRGLRYLFCLLWIAWKRVWERPVLIHFHFYQVPVLDFLLVTWLNWTGCQIVTTVHDVLPFKLGTDYQTARGSYYHRIYCASTALIVNSAHTRDLLLELDPELADKTRLIPAGHYLSMAERLAVDPEQARLHLGLNSDAGMILVFGSIKPNKRLDLIIRALAELSDLDVRLVVAGKPQNKDMDQYYQLADDLGISDNIIWHLEKVNDQELGYYFSAADVVVFPYQWIYQSAALLMAMSFAKAVLGTEVGSNPEYIVNHENGVLVPLDQPGLMAEEIRQLFLKPEYRRKMGSSAYRYVKEELSWTEIAVQTQELYHQVLHTSLSKGTYLENSS